MNILKLIYPAFGVKISLPTGVDHMRDFDTIWDQRQVIEKQRLYIRDLDARIVKLEHEADGLISLL